MSHKKQLERSRRKLGESAPCGTGQKKPGWQEGPVFCPRGKGISDGRERGVALAFEGVRP